MGSGDSGKSSRGPRGRRRQRGGGKQSGGRGGGGGGKQRARHESQAPRKGKAFSTPYEVPETGPIAPFDLFCACYLGIMPDGSYRSMGFNEVAKRLRRSPGDLKQALQDYGMDAEALKQAGFDISLAKLDMQVAPEGMDRRELARGLFEELLEYHPELEEAEARYQAEKGDAPAAPGPVTRANHHKPEPAPEPEEVEAVDEPAPQEKEAKDDVAAGRDAPDEEGEVEVVSAANSPDQSRSARSIRRSPVRRGGGN